jgi:hypothetical protein
MVYQDHNVKDYHWVHHSEGNPARDVLRLCVCEIIRPYSETKGGTIVDVEGHQPITWVDGLSKENLADPHNGVLKSFDRPPPVGTKCTLHYYHWMNAKVQAGETDRTAKKAETFTLEERSVTADIYIASQP